MRKEEFVKAFLPLALKAEKEFSLNPVVILAQAAIESGWGLSILSRDYHNFFGITAYGRPNKYWKGEMTDMEGLSYLFFRRYETDEDSFLDFARLITTSYKLAASVSYQPTAYAKEIAYSRYISEVNGDDRVEYRNLLVVISQSIEETIRKISTKN